MPGGLGSDIESNKVAPKSVESSTAKSGSEGLLDNLAKTHGSPVATIVK